MSDGNDLVVRWYAVAQTPSAEKSTNLDGLIDLVADLNNVDTIWVVRTADSETIVNQGGWRKSACGADSYNSPHPFLAAASTNEYSFSSPSTLGSQ